MGRASGSAWRAASCSPVGCERVREALLADGRTSRLADGVDVETDGGVVIIRATVDDLDDADLLAEVASAVTGVLEVRDETEVRGL